MTPPRLTAKDVRELKRLKTHLRPTCVLAREQARTEAVETLVAHRLNRIEELETIVSNCHREIDAANAKIAAVLAICEGILSGELLGKWDDTHRMPTHPEASALIHRNEGRRAVAQTIQDEVRNGT